MQSADGDGLRGMEGATLSNTATTTTGLLAALSLAVPFRLSVPMLGTLSTLRTPNVADCRIAGFAAVGRYDRCDITILAVQMPPLSQSM